MVTKSNVPALEAEAWNTPLSCHMIVVGKDAYNLLHRRYQDRVFYPPRSNKPGYYGAVGKDYEDTVKRLAKVLDTIDKGAGKDFENRMALRAPATGANDGLLRRLLRRR